MFKHTALLQKDKINSGCDNYHFPFLEVILAMRILFIYFTPLSLSLPLVTPPPPLPSNLSLVLRL